MKKLSTLFVFAILIISCSGKRSSALGSDNDPSIVYAYSISNPNQWEWGDKNNIRIALDGLKAYEKGNISAALKDYADTVVVQMDGFEGRVTKDSLLTLLIRERSQIKRMAIEMNDFISLRSKNGGNEYVSLWYKQLWEDQNGRVDSVQCMDDIAFKNGKIVLLNEKVRRYGGRQQ